LSKPTVSAKQAVDDILAGKTDEEIMKKYNLSARGLESLFTKLLHAGVVQQSDIDNRMLKSQRSHLVDLVDYPELNLPKTQVRARDAVEDIRAGMSDLQLMEKFNLSAKGLDSLFQKLIAVGKIRQDELDARRSSFDWAALAYSGADATTDTGTGTSRPSDASHRRSTAQTEQYDLPDPLIKRSRSSSFTDYRVLMAAIGGGLVGMALLVIVGYFTGIVKTEHKFVYSELMAPLEEAVNELQREATNLLAILESIPGGETEAEPTQSRFDACMQLCERDHPGFSEEDRVLRLNCKRECLAKFNETLVRIRERFHTSPMGE
jgi:uncharacterized protein (DUF433 family)